MRIVADECCAASLVQALCQDGHDIVYVGEEFAGHSDDEVLDHALKERRLSFARHHRAPIALYAGSIQ